MRRPWGYVLIAAVVAALFGADQLSKLWVQANLALYTPVEVVPRVLQLVYYPNHGAVGGLGARSPITIPVLVAASVVVIALLVLLHRQYGRVARPTLRMHLFTAFAIAPLLSHSFDRVRQGYVVDFLHFGGSPVFNLADVMPHLAILLLVLELWTHVRSRRLRPVLLGLAGGE